MNRNEKQALTALDGCDSTVVPFAAADSLLNLKWNIKFFQLLLTGIFYRNRSAMNAASRETAGVPMPTTADAGYIRKA